VNKDKTLALLVIELQISGPEDLPEAIRAIRPPTIPHFGGGIHVAMDAFGDDETDNPATAIVNYLKGEGE
jgi:hypothetical protein